MDPTALVMERLAGEWAVFISHVTTFALRGSIVLAVGLAVLVVVASLSSQAGARQPATAGDDGAAQTSTQVQTHAPTNAEIRRPAYLRLVVPSESSARTDTQPDVYVLAAWAYELGNA